jgi:hypothetical protein
VTEGRGPFQGDTPLAQLFATVNQPHPEPEHAGPLRELIDGLLAKEPEDRWTAGRTRDALRSVVSAPPKATAGIRQVTAVPDNRTVGVPDNGAGGGARTRALTPSA